MRAPPAACFALLSALAGTGAAVAASGSIAPAGWADTSANHPVATSRTRHVLGYSVDHRPIVAWLIGPRHARRSVLVVGSIAGDEPVWLIPDMNPDGAGRGTLSTLTAST